MDNLPRSVRALSRSLLLICQLIQSFRRLGLGFGGLPVYGLKRALDADVASRQHRFRNRKKLTNKVEVRIVRHGPVTLSPLGGAFQSIYWRTYFVGGHMGKYGLIKLGLAAVM